MVCWSTLETLACISQVLCKVRVGYPVLSLPHIHSSCMYFTFQSHFPLWCSNRIQAFNQLFKRWLLSTLCRISTVHPQRWWYLYPVSCWCWYRVAVLHSSQLIIRSIHPRKRVLNHWEPCTINTPSAFVLLCPSLWREIAAPRSEEQGRYFGWCLVQVVLSKKSWWLEMMGLEVGIHGATSGLPPVNPCSIPPCLPQLPNWPCITLPGGWVMRNRRLETSQPASARPLKSC